MGLYKKKVLKVSKGQITPKLIERTDIGILDSSGQTIDGFINSKYGNLSTIPGTKLGYVFGADKAVRLFIVNLLDGTDAVLAINATDDYLLLLDKTGTAISTQISALGKFSADTLNQVSIAQNNDLILIASPGNPLYQIAIDSNNVITFGLITIDQESVIKVNTLSYPQITPVVYRDDITTLPTTDASYFSDNGIKVGDYLLINETTSTAPSESFPWTVKQVELLPDASRYSIVSGAINNLGIGYVLGDEITVPSGGQFTITSDAGSYVARTSVPTISYPIRSITYGNGICVAVVSSSLSSSVHTNYMLKSTDNGATWTATQYSTGATNNLLNRVKYVNGVFIAVGNNGLIITSTDGTSWTARTSGVTDSLQDISYKNNVYLIVGFNGRALTSTNLSSWTSQTTGVSSVLYSVDNDGTDFVISGESGVILTSSNGTSFTSQTSGTANGLNRIKYLNGKFVACGLSGTVIYSTNKTSWTTATTGVTTLLYDICYSGGWYSMVTTLGNVLTSTDLSSFLVENTGGSNTMLACESINGLVNVFGGNGGTIVTQSTCELTLDNPYTSYTSDPAGTAVSVSGGSGTGMTADIVSSAATATYSDATYTAVDGDYCRNIWDESDWVYSTSWNELIDSYSTDTTFTVAWRVSAVSGYVTITMQSGAYIAITKPSSYTGTPEQYAKKIMTGVRLDGNAALGVITIDSITGSTSGSDYRITAISGMSYITFVSTAVTVDQVNFTIMFSYAAAFDTDYPGSVNNPRGTSNFPKSIFFYQQRLVIAGTKLDTAQLIWSQTALYNDFSDDLSGAATNAFQLRISGTEYESIQNVVLNQGIQIFTDKSEWLMNDSIITKNSGFIQNSKVGSSVVKPVIGANGITLFVQRNGLGLLGFIYNNTNASFNTPYISLFTDIIDTEIIDMCLKKGYSSNDDVLVYLTLSNGKLAIANYMNDQQIQAFVGQSSSSYLQAVQADSTIILLTEVNGSVCVEITDSDKYTWGSYDNFVYDFSTGIVSGLPNQYNGLSVNVYDQNHDFIGEYAVSSNTFTITGDVLPTSLTEIGFNIHSIFVSNPIDINSNTFSLYKTIKNIRLVVNESNKTDYLKINNKNGRNYNGFVSYPRPARPLRKQQFTIENDVYPVEIYSMEIEVEA